MMTFITSTLKQNKMKNIFLIPTDKPSRLIIQNGNRLIIGVLDYSIIENRQNIYITSNEEIKEGDWYLDTFNTQRIKANKYSDHKHYGNSCKKIILTTDADLIADGVQTIDDDFLQWFVKNHSCEQIEVNKQYSDFTVDPFVGYKIIIPNINL